MDRGYLDLVSDWIVARDAAAVGAVLGLNDVSPQAGVLAALGERAADLTRPDRLAAVVAELADPAAGVRAARRLELVLDAVVGLSVGEASSRARVLRAEPVIEEGATRVPFDALDAWIGQQRDTEQLAAHRGSIEAGLARVGDAEQERCDALRRAGAALALPSPWTVRARARDRASDDLGSWARSFLDASRPMLPLAESTHGSLPAWLSLPLRLARADLSAALPDPDPSLAAFVSERLGVARLYERHVRFDLAGRPGKPARDIVLSLPDRRGVLAARRPLGRLRDYRGQLRLLGRALCRAGLERAEGIDRFRADPGLERMYGALLEAQLLRPAWHERTLGRLPPQPVLGAWRLQSVARTARLAAEVVAADRDLPAVCPAVPVVLTRERSADLPMLPPVGATPWSCPAGDAQDELAGRLVAFALDDWLCSRWGSAWSLEPSAGSLLRDLWAAGHPTARALCADLGLDPPGVDAALDVLRAGRR